MRALARDSPLLPSCPQLTFEALFDAGTRPVAASHPPTPCHDSIKRPNYTQKRADPREGVQAVFNFASCSIVSSALTIAGGGGPVMLGQVLIGHFALLFVLVSGTMPISGGHFNPMVSIVMAYWGALERRRLPMYLLAQYAGAGLGSSLQYQLLPAGLRDAAHAGVQVCTKRCASQQEHCLQSTCVIPHLNQPDSRLPDVLLHLHSLCFCLHWPLINRNRADNSEPETFCPI